MAKKNPKIRRTVKKPTKGVDYTGIAVVYFCHDGKGNFIMARRGKNTRDEHGRWDIGGGGLEFGQTAEETLRREIMEEYCSEVLDFQFLGFRDVHRKMPNGKPTHWIALDYKVLVDRGKVKIGEPENFDKLGWFTLTSIPRKTHSQLPVFLSLYKSRL